MLNCSEGRMISLPWRREGWGDVKKPKIGEHELRDDQAYLIQSLGLRKDSEGKYITSSDALQIASRHYQINIDTISNWRGLFPAFDVLDNMDNNEAIMVRNYIEDPRHWTFFGDKARTLHLKYSREGVLGYPAGTPSPVIDA